MPLHPVHSALHGTAQDRVHAYEHESIQHTRLGPSMSFYRESSPLFSTADHHHLPHHPPPPAASATLHQQRSCGPDGLNQFLVEDLFSASQSSSNKSAILEQPQPPPPGPPLIPLASRPRTSTWPSTTSTPLTFPDLNAPTSVPPYPYLALSFDRVQDRHAAFDAALGSPLLDGDGECDFSPANDDDACAPSVWDGSPAMTDVDPVWGARGGDEDEAGAQERERGLRLFGQLSVEANEMEAMVRADREQQQQAARAPAPTYSPVLAPMDVEEDALSPPPFAILPPLPTIADVEEHGALDFEPPAPPPPHPPPSSPSPPLAAADEPIARSTRSRRSASASTTSSSAAPAPTAPATTSFALPVPPSFAPQAPSVIRTRASRTSRAPSTSAASLPITAAAAAVRGTSPPSAVASPAPAPTAGSSGQRDPTRLLASHPLASTTPIAAAAMRAASPPSAAAAAASTTASASPAPGPSALDAPAPRRPSRPPAPAASTTRTGPRTRTRTTSPSSSRASPSAPTPTPFDPNAPRVALDAPTRARTYSVESRTSRKR
ncbi:hypothetical protein JCM8208_005818 [Rhodotorula glutinis]